MPDCDYITAKKALTDNQIVDLLKEICTERFQGTIELQVLENSIYWFKIFENEDGLDYGVSSSRSRGKRKLKFWKDHATDFLGDWVRGGFLHELGVKCNGIISYDSVPQTTTPCPDWYPTFYQYLCKKMAFYQENEELYRKMVKEAYKIGKKLNAPLAELIVDNATRAS